MLSIFLCLCFYFYTNFYSSLAIACVYTTSLDCTFTPGFLSIEVDQYVPQSPVMLPAGILTDLVDLTLYREPGNPQVSWKDTDGKS